MSAPERCARCGNTVQHDRGCLERDRPLATAVHRHAPADVVEHDLKSDPEPFDAVASGAKRAEFRVDDREPRYAVGHRLRLRRFDRTCTECFNVDHNGDRCFRCHGKTRGYTGREIVARVTHVTRGPHVPDGFAMLSIEVLG